MREKVWSKRIRGIMLAALLLAGLGACGKETQGTDPSLAAGGTHSETVTEEAAEGTAEATENASGTEEGSERENSAKTEQGEADVSGISAEEEADPLYSVTEENENPDFLMEGRPEVPYWFPEQLLAWEPEKDEDLRFHRSTVPLAERVDLSELETVNSTQNRDTKVMAISIMNRNTSGNTPHGLNRVDVNAFSYWQYVDTLVYWGGSAGEGLVTAPGADVVDAGHRNGVRVLGTVFLPQTYHGGKMEWVETFLTRNKDGSYPLADKLVEAAQVYGFDGWFINQETEGTAQEPLTEEHGARMQEFLAYFKEQAPELQLIYYDSMTIDGKMKWQNALTKKNMAFLRKEDGTRIADGMFINFGWTDSGMVSSQLLRSSAELARQQEIDPYDLYAGIDLQSNGYGTMVRWNLFENPEGGTHTSLGLYCPSWAFFASDSVEEFWQKENRLWVNAQGDPSAQIQAAGDIQWRGISTYVVERTAVTQLPFVTNFSTGNGRDFYKNGQRISRMDWNNRSLSDILPTYRYLIEDGEGNQLTAGLDMGDAYYGGSSILLQGSMKQGKTSVIKLYAAGLPLADRMVYTTTAKALGAEVALEAVLSFEDGTELVLEGDRKVGSTWTTVSYDLSGSGGKTLRGLSYRLTADQDVAGLQLRLGNITMAEEGTQGQTLVRDLQVLDSEFDQEGRYAGVRLAWGADGPAHVFEVYRVNEDGRRSLLGVSNTDSFYVHGLPRIQGMEQTVFQVVPVNILGEEGEGALTFVEWPDAQAPRVDFAAEVTLAAPGETIAFHSICSQEVSKVSWSFPGAETESSEGDTATATYSKEGVYAVSVRAENEAGTGEASREGYIVITQKASEGLALLSQGAAVEADSYVNEQERPEFAVDGDWSRKWCAVGSAPHELTLDLGEVHTVSGVKLYHAQAGGEGEDMNTEAYTIFTSLDGERFDEAVRVTGNTAGETEDAFAPVEAQYVRLVVDKPAQGTDSAARIYEMEVYGLEGKLQED